MKQTKNGGFSLIETVVAIAILGLITVPCTSGLLMSIRLNEKAQQMMQAQLAVSSAVETLMAEGIDKTIAGWAIANGVLYDACFPKQDGQAGLEDRFPDVMVEVSKKNSTDPYYTVTVRDNAETIGVKTTIREKEGGSQ